MKRLLLPIFLFTLAQANIINIPYDYPKIQEGINAANDGDTVLVQPGTYIENINFTGKNITIASLTFTTQDVSYISKTVIDGNQSGSVVTFENEEDSMAVLNGFTITNGLSDALPGGIYCKSSSPTLENLIIINNSGGDGGGIGCAFHSSPKLKNVTIQHNNAHLKGGGVVCGINSNPIFENVKIINNTAYEGGGFWFFRSNPILNNVTIIGNTADAGGGIYCIDHSSPNLVNVTISGNTSGDSKGGGIYCISSSPNLTNTILWGNSPQEIYFDLLPSSITISYSDVQGGEKGIVNNYNGPVKWLNGNINIDPLFVNVKNDDFHLRADSPCIDAGNPDSQYNDTDGSRNDIGAYGGLNGDW